MPNIIEINNKYLDKLYPSDIAQLIEENNEIYTNVYNHLKYEKFLDVFIELEDDTKLFVYKGLPIDSKKKIANSLDIDEVKKLFLILDDAAQLKITTFLPKLKQNQLHLLLSYEEESSASISSPHFVSVPISLTVKEATEFVIKNTLDKDEIEVVFITDSQGLYKGAIVLSDLILARENKNIIDVYNKSYPYVKDTDNYYEAIRKIRDYDLMLIPVVNKENKILGVISYDDVISIMQEQHQDAIKDMVKADEEDDEASAVKRSINRLPWLLASAGLNIVIASFLAVFQGTLSSNVAIVLFQSMILGMAGNIGTQSISVTILGLTQNKIKPKKHILSESLIGLVNGIISGLIGAVIVYIFFLVFPDNTTNTTKLAITIGISLALSMFISALFGVLIPIVLRKFGLDEKAASGPLISTINDFSALGIYYLVATILLMNL